MITTAHKAGEVDPQHVAVATDWMKRLNKDAATALAEASPSAVTDITGFGLLGHLWEMIGRCEAQARIHFDALPFHPGALQYADEMLFPGGANNNLRAYREFTTFDDGLQLEMQLLVACPETSGGLLIAISPEQVKVFARRFAELGHRAWRIGEVIEGEPKISIV